jgi:hypothetical protein
MKLCGGNEPFLSSAAFLCGRTAIDRARPHPKHGNPGCAADEQTAMQVHFPFLSLGRFLAAAGSASPVDRNGNPLLCLDVIR